VIPEIPSEAVSLRMAAPHVALVTIDRPLARNAINGTVARGLDRAVESTERDDDVWAVVLTGAGGKAFCAGADLKEIAAGRAQELSTERGGFAGFVRYERRKPWIAAVDGFALAGGCEIVLACDMVVASVGSVFGLPETSRGLIAAAGGAYRLPRVLPRNLAFEMIATGAPMEAERAHAFGLVNKLAPAGSAVAAALSMAATVCENAPIAVWESLKIARASADQDESSLRQLTKDAQKHIAETADYKEGPRAFIEKRSPRWTGR
jgi:enoyl-CoA hydratase/carnithine racemase